MIESRWHFFRPYVRPCLIVSREPRYICASGGPQYIRELPWTWLLAPVGVPLIPEIGNMNSRGTTPKSQMAKHFLSTFLSARLLNFSQPTVDYLASTIVTSGVKPYKTRRSMAGTDMQVNLVIFIYKNTIQKHPNRQLLLSISKFQEIQGRVDCCKFDYQPISTD